MFKILNDLKEFFEDNYCTIGVREYGKRHGISPATSSKLLQEYHKQGILRRQKDKMYIYYSANRSNTNFQDLSRIYWRIVLEKIELLDYFEKEFANPVVILFGSAAKSEVLPKSDIDIALFSAAKKEINLAPFEKKLKREIQLFQFHSLNAVKNKELLHNIMMGYILMGTW